MKVFVQSVNFNMDKDLKEYVAEKITSLNRFYDKVIGVEVFLKVQKTSEKENKIAEVKLNVPGDEMMVKKLSKTFEESISLAVEALKRNLEKLKAKQRNY